MGCFSACFFASKHHKLLQSKKFSTQQHQIDFIKLEEIQQPICPIEKSKEKIDIKVKCQSQKKVTFDLNVETNEKAISEIQIKEESAEDKIKECKSQGNLNAGSNRYQNCIDIDDEYEEMGLNGNDLGTELHRVLQPESSDSLFSLSIDSRKHVYGVEMGENEVNSPMPKQYPVLNPVENRAQLKDVKSRATPPLQDQNKENINMMPLNHNMKLDLDQEILVDASLSSWLVESECTPTLSKRSNSSKSVESRPVLGELKQISASVSPRLARNGNDDDKSVVGTVGNYWSHIGKKIMDSTSQSSCRGMMSMNIEV